MYKIYISNSLQLLLCVIKLEIMIRSVFITILIFFLALFSVFSQIADNYPLSSFEIKALDRFFLEIGQVPPFYSRPFSNYQYLYYLKKIERRKDELSIHSRGLFKLLLQKHIRQSERESFLFPVLEGSAGLKYQSDNIPEKQKYLYYRKSLYNTPLLNLGFIAGFPNAVIHVEYDLRKDFFVASRQSDYSTIPTGDPFVQEFDFNFPTRSYLKVGNLNLDLLIGREQMKWGPGYRSSLVLSDSPPYYDMVYLSYFSDFFKATFFFAALESYLTEDELEIQEAMWGKGVIIFEKNYYPPEQYKTLTGHRFEFSLFEKVLIGISDIIVIGGRAPELNEITPLMYLHNVYGGNYSNVMVGFDISAVPFRNAQIYGEFAIDDIQNPLEGESSIPTSVGYLAGIHLVNIVLPGNPDFRFEWARVDPWMYNRWQPYLIFSSRKKLVSLPDFTDNSSYLDFPTGYFLGGDVQSFYFELSWDYNFLLETSISYEFRQKGPIYLDVLDTASEFDNYKTNSDSTPTGTPVVSHIGGIKVLYHFSTVVSLSGDISIGYQYNREHLSGNNGYFFEAMLNCSVKLDRGKY